MRFLLQHDLWVNNVVNDEDGYIIIGLDDLWEATIQHYKYPRIRFGNPICCTYMMYIACVGFDIGCDLEIELTDKDWTTFIRIKNKFIAAGRLPRESKLKLTERCCY